MDSLRRPYNLGMALTCMYLSVMCVLCGQFEETVQSVRQERDQVSDHYQRHSEQLTQQIQQMTQQVRVDMRHTADDTTGEGRHASHSTGHNR